MTRGITYRLPDGSADQPDENGQHTATVNVLHSAEQYARFPGCPDCKSIAQSQDPEYQAAIRARTAHIHPVVDRAEITESPAEPGPYGMPAHLTVRTIWRGDGLDRTDGSGWAVKDRRMAGRFGPPVERPGWCRDREQAVRLGRRAVSCPACGGGGTWLGAPAAVSISTRWRN
jgi:Zn finger protein HypA/HybF involved in hydrogenase expression